MGEQGRQTPPAAESFIAGTPQVARDLVTDVVVGAEISIASLSQGPEPEVRRGESLDLHPTHIPGFYLVVGAGDEVPDMKRGAISELAAEVRVYYLRDRVIKELQLLQEPLHDSLVRKGMANPGLRGGQDDNLGGQVQLNPTRRINADLLQESLGDDIGEYTHSKTVLTIELDPDKDDIEGITRAFRGVLKRRGKDPERLKANDSLSIDRDKLLKAVKKGDITLLPGTITVGLDKDKDWQLTPRTVVTLPAVKEAVVRAAKSFGLRNPESEAKKNVEASIESEVEVEQVFPSPETN